MQAVDGLSRAESEHAYASRVQYTEEELERRMRRLT